MFRGVIKNRFLIIFLNIQKIFFVATFFSELGNIRSHPFLRILALDSEAEINRSKHKREVTGAIIGVWNWIKIILGDFDHQTFGIDGGAFFGNTFRDRQYA